MGSPGVWRVGDAVLVRGSAWKVLESTSGEGCTALRLQSLCAGDRARRTLLSPFDRVRALHAPWSSRYVRLHRWLHTVRRRWTTLHPAGGLRMAAAASVRLMPHQIEPALAMLRHAVLRVLVADDVGLGKTIQAGLVIAELAGRSAEARVIVLVPSGLREQWESELMRHFSLMPTQAHARWLHAMASACPPDANPWSLPGIYIASHDFVKRPEVLRPLEDVTWDLVVVDEAHASGATTDRRAAAHALAARSRRVMLLTATPRWDDPTELEALCAIGRHGSEGPLMFFRRGQAGISGTPGRRCTLLLVQPTDAERRMHLLLKRYTDRVWAESGQRGDGPAKLAAIVLRKRALSSAASLGRSVRRRLDLLGAGSVVEQLRLPLADEDPLPDDIPDATLAAPGLSDARRERRWLSAIAAAAGFAAPTESKIRRLTRLLARVREPLIVFTEYRDTLSRLAQAVATATGRPPLVMHGGLTAAERSGVQRTFNDAGMLLIATDAAAEGLNLQARCRLILHYELPWSPTRLAQRAGRVDRLGQTRRVHEIALVAADTAERLVLSPLVLRASRARAAGTATGLLDGLTESRVADAILSGAAVPPDASKSIEISRFAVPSPPTLTSEAQAEVRRLEEHRACLSVSSPPPRRLRAEAAAIAMLKRPVSLPRGLFLVFALTARGTEGRVIHGEPLVLHVELEPVDVLAQPHALRTLAMTLAASPPASVRAALAAALHSAQRNGEAVEGPMRNELARRERGIAGIHVPAASQLVQVGLFDRRALRAAEWRARSRELLLQDSSARLEQLAGSSACETEAELIGALLVGRRPS